MVKDVNGNKRQKVWLEEVMETVDVTGLSEVNETDKGLELAYDPEVFTLSQGNEMIALAERDEIFGDYYIDVEANKVCFHY